MVDNHADSVERIRAIPRGATRDEAMIEHAFVSGCDVRRLMAEVEGRAPISTLVGREVPWPSPLETAALHGPAGHFVEVVAPHSEADPAALLGIYLAAAGALFGPEPHVKVESTRHPARLFVAVVGRTSKARKGTALDRVYDVSRRASRDLDTLSRDGIGSGEAVVHAVRDPVILNGETRDHGAQDKRLLIVEPELARVFSVMKRPGSILSPVLRCAWDSGRLHNTTKHNPESATNAHIVVIGLITARELDSLLDSLSTANGFANRFLYFAAERSQLLPFGGELRTSELEALAGSMAAAIDFARDVGEVGWSESAKPLWEFIYSELSAPQPGVIGAVTARAEAQVLRLALTYALLDRSRVIAPPHLGAAIAVWDYCAASAAHFFSTRIGHALADKLLGAMRTTPGGLAREALHAATGRHATSAELDEALNLLKHAGLAMDAREVTGGRPREVWKLCEESERSEG